jgi:cytochrome c oxidase subunit IV
MTNSYYHPDYFSLYDIARAALVLSLVIVPAAIIAAGIIIVSKGLP